MPNRESLHELIDTLPEAALESTERVSRPTKLGRQSHPLTVEKMREYVDELFRRRGDEMAARTEAGFTSFSYRRREF